MNPRQNRPNNRHCHFSLPGRSSMKYIFKLRGASLQQEVLFEALKTSNSKIWYNYFALELFCPRVNLFPAPCWMKYMTSIHKFTSIEMTAAFDYIKNYSPRAFPQVMIYMAKEAPFSSNLFGKDYENISATSWLKTGRRL